MPVKFSVRVRRFRPPEMMLRQWNDIIREALKEAAEFWIATCLPKHFEQGASQRYQYEKRREAYLRLKRIMEKVRPWIGTKRQAAYIPAPKPPRPWVWSGMTIDKLLKRSPSDFNIQARATSKRQTVRVPLPVPHPTNPNNVGELGKMTRDEFRMMSEIALAVVRLKLQDISQEITTRIAA